MPVDKEFFEMIPEGAVVRKEPPPSSITFCCECGKVVVIVKNDTCGVKCVCGRLWKSSKDFAYARCKVGRTTVQVPRG